MPGAVLINKATQQPEWVSADKVQEALDSGTYFARGGTVNVESKYSGAKYKAPVSTIGSQADRQGYQAIHAGEAIGQQAEAEKNAAVDNLGDKFLTFAEGAASSLTFGGFDALQNYVDPNNKAGRRANVNSGWRSVGELAGLVAPALATGGAFAAVEGAEVTGAGLLKSTVREVLGYTPAGLASKVAGRAGAKAAARFAEGTLAKSLAAGAVESAVEGAMWSTGQTLSNAIIEDKELSGEAVLSSVLEGGALGAGIGGGFALLGRGVKAIKDKISARNMRMAHPLFDLESEASKAFRGEIVGSIDDAFKYGRGIDAKIVALDKLEAQAGAKLEGFNAPARRAAHKEYLKAADEMKKWLRIPKNEVLTPEKMDEALKHFMAGSSKKDIVKFAKALDNLHVKTAEMDDLFRPLASDKYEAEALMKRPMDMPASPVADVNKAGLGKGLNKAANAGDEIAAEAGGYSAKPEKGLQSAAPGVPEAPVAPNGTVNIRGQASEAIPGPNGTGNIRNQVPDLLGAQPMAKGGALIDQAAAVNAVADKAPVDNVAAVNAGADQAAVNSAGGFNGYTQSAADYNDVVRIKNKIVSGALEDLSRELPGFSKSARFAERVKKAGEHLKDDAAAKFNALDALAIADALGMDSDKIPVLGPVADSALKMWMFYRMGGLVAEAGSKVVKRGGRSIVKHGIYQGVARKAAEIGRGKAGAFGAGFAYEAAYGGAKAAVEGTSKVGIATGRVSSRIEGAVRSVLTPGLKKAIKKSVPGAYYQLSNVSFGHPLDMDPKDDYGRIEAQLSRVLTNKDATTAYLNKMLEDFRILDPGMADAMIKAQLAQHSYLYSKLPQPPSPLWAKIGWAPPASKLIEFTNAVRVYHNPMSVVQNVEDGTATRDELDNLKALWPSLHTKLVDAAVSMAEHLDKLSPEQVKMFSIITGAPMHASLDPKMISFTQDDYMSKRRQQDSQNATIAGANSMKSGIKQTPGQQYGSLNR